MMLSACDHALTALAEHAAPGALERAAAALDQRAASETDSGAPYTAQDYAEAAATLRKLAGADAESIVRVPAWFYVQRQPGGGASFVGASLTNGPNPLHFGSGRLHQFVVGELGVRADLVVATDTLRGEGLGWIAQSDHDLRAMLSDGEVVTTTDHGRGMLEARGITA